MQIKIGIISASKIAGDFMISCRNLDQSHYKVVAIASTNLRAAQELAKKHNVPRAYGTYQELCKDNEVQLVYVTTRNHHHYAAAKLAIENKKHVLVEKPFTIDVETTKELFALGKKHGVFVMEALWPRFLKAFQKFREIIKSGEIGELIHCSSHFIVSFMADRILYKRYGGGVGPDLGVYALNSIFEGVGYIAPKSVKAFGRPSIPGESETSVSAILDFPNEVTATMILTARLGDGNQEKSLQQVLYICTKGYIKIDDYCNCPHRIEVNGRIIDKEIIMKNTQNLYYTGYNWANSYGLCHELEEVRKCIMNNQLTSSVHTPENTILLTETIRKVIAEVGTEVIDTPRDYSFKHD